MGQFQSTEVCTTPACIQTASHLLGNLAPHWRDMDPCTNFDEMVCYGFNQHFDDPDNGVDLAAKPNYRLLREILSRPYEEAKNVKPYILSRRDNADEHNFEMLRRSYEACMDTTAISKAGIKPLQDAIARLNEQWPVEMKSVDEPFDPVGDKAGLQAVTIALEKLNIRTWSTKTHPIARYNRMADPVNPKLQRFLIYVPDTTLSIAEASLYEDDDTVALLEARIAGALAAVFPEKIDERTARSIASDILALETELLSQLVEADAAQKAAEDPKEDPQVRLKKTVVSMEDLAALTPTIGLDAIVSALVPEGHKPEAVRVLLPGLWPGVEEVVNKQRKIVLQSWLFWKMVHAMGSYVESAELKAVGVGGEAASNEYGACIDHVDSSLRWTLGHFFVEASYNNLTRSTATKLAVNIREEMKEHVNKLTWMSEPTKKRTLKKLERMALNIGYPEEEPNAASPDSLAAFYSGLNITDSYFDNAAAGRGYQVVTDMKGLLRPTSQKEWTLVHTLITNAQYESNSNSILIPAGVSKLPMFHPDLPQWALYGGLGAIIGHEITHGLDSRGKTKDENALETNWWDDKTDEEYNKRAQCFAKQFSEFSVVGADGKRYSGDGNVTLAESISDAGGLAVAYDAWAKERKSMPKTWDQSLPGLEEFSHEQLFFVTYANNWCNAYGAAKKAQVVRSSGQHPLDQFRILGGAENSRAFREAFKCPKKEPRCEIF
ncbi:hypothetical protein QBC40DRAFT_267043 [Triangularia verruculosa]|uniref:Endothelin-converting enzyme 1 n=1 Tax=Triangularia verruculosa TaxID=2587418 RepID=A0AAN7ATM0_9PEZI|nr:hypothetical protein QBC40DRAFT_267043 [Triangularia verruculosa]